MSVPIEDYALLGDGQTAALVSKQGSIDWLCWPRFDSDACFAALLGSAENGRWSIAPEAKIIGVSWCYQDDTLVMETDFETEHGAVRLTDFMPIRGACSSVVRIVTGLRGTVAMLMDLTLRFDYGSLPPWSEPTAHGFVAKLGPDLVVLHASAPMSVDAHQATAAFDVTAGGTFSFVLSHSPSDRPVPEPLDVLDALITTQTYWREWIGRFDDAKTHWPAVVRRSLITLKAMIYQPSGGLVAAPTTSLPEAPGGDMNWDYRYCWLRDSTFTLSALLNAGFQEEAQQWRDWLLRAIAGSPARMRIMYRIDGARHLSEWLVDTLPGYRYSSPVRVGNAASTQHQIDVFGEVLDSLSFARRAGVPVSPQERSAERAIVAHLEKVWDTEGSGVWESRKELRQYTYSKAMAWVGVDRFLRQYGPDGPASDDGDDETIKRLSALRGTIHDEVCREGWNEGLGTFTQHYGGQEIDASLLLLPLVGFLPATDQRMKATIETIERELSEGGLIRRMKAKATGPNEGAFLACSCWMADCLNLLGRSDDARAQLERVLAVANDLGLWSEEYNVPGKHLAGNFPQALTHLAVVNTALGLSGRVLARGGG